MKNNIIIKIVGEGISDAYIDTQEFYSTNYRVDIYKDVNGFVANKYYKTSEGYRWLGETVYVNRKNRVGYGDVYTHLKTRKSLALQILTGLETTREEIIAL